MVHHHFKFFMMLQYQIQEWCPASLPATIWPGLLYLSVNTFDSFQM